jgi:hypothetical protein
MPTRFLTLTIIPLLISPTGLVTPALAAQMQSIQEQVRAISAQTPVEVRLRDRGKLRGWLGEVSASGFELRCETKNRLDTKTFAFDAVKSIRIVDTVKPRHTARSILIGVGIAVGAIFITSVIVFRGD